MTEQRHWAGIGIAVLLTLLTPAQASELRDGIVRPAEGFAHLEAFSGASTVGTGNALAISLDRLITACHVVRGAERLMLGRDGYRHASELAGYVPHADLCLLTRPQLLPTRALRLETTTPHTGAALKITGIQPDGSGHRLSIGTVIAQITAEGVPLILTNAQIPPGMSGGAAFNAEGAVIGVAVGRWRAPALGVVVATSALQNVKGISPSNPVQFPALPSFLDERHMWPQMLRLGLMLTRGRIGERSTITDGWSFSDDGTNCRAVTADTQQADLGVTLTLVRGDDQDRIRLSVERNNIPMRRAIKPLTLTLYPEKRTFRLRPTRLTQTPEQIGDNTWNARWDLDEADTFLTALPASTALVASSHGRDLGALPLDPAILWRGLRDTCL